MMNEDGTKRDRVLGRARSRASKIGSASGNEQSLTRWLERELDSRRGADPPADLRLAGCLEILQAEASRGRAWPAQWSDPVDRLVQATLWFARRDGRPGHRCLIGPPATRPARLDSPRPCVRLDRSQASSGSSSVTAMARDPESLMATTLARARWGDRDRVLDVLRPGWPADGRLPGGRPSRCWKSSSQFELFGAGRSWLGPAWKIDVSRPRPRRSATSILDRRIPPADLAEWSYRAGRGANHSIRAALGQPVAGVVVAVSSNIARLATWLLE